MTQPPVRYESYPPDEGESADGSKDQRTPIIRPYVPAQLPPPPATSGTSRRTVIGLVIGIPVAGIILSAVAAGSSFSNYDGTGGGLPDFPDDTDDSDDPDYTADPGSYGEGDPGSYDEDFSVGDHTATAPSGWTVNDDGSRSVEVTNGANRLTAVSFDTGTSTLAVDEIVHLAKTHRTGFSGKITDPVDRSSADVQHATLDGTGKFKGKAARLMSELWIDEEGSGLLVVRILTAKVASVISRQAQEMLEDLSGDF